MTKQILIAWIGVMVMGYGQPLGAGEFDGSRALQCKTSDGVQYHRQGGPQPFQPESVGLAQIFLIDFNRNKISPGRQSVIRRNSKIKRIERVEDKIVLQGADDGVEGVDDGVGWTLALMRGNGRFVITASGGDVGYIVFGRCQSANP